MNGKETILGRGGRRPVTPGKGARVLVCALLMTVIFMAFLPGIAIADEDNVRVNAHAGHSVRPGERARVEISVGANGTANYTVELLQRARFTILEGDSITRLMYGSDTERFAFWVMAGNDTTDGTYPFEYRVYKEDMIVYEGTVNVFVGRGGGGACGAVIIPVGAAFMLGAVFLWRRRR